MLLALGRDKPESGLGSSARDVERFLVRLGAALMLGEGQEGAVLRQGPSVSPPGPWLQTQMEKGQEKHLPPSSPALWYQFCPA